MKPIRVLLAEDHALVRSGIRALLDATEGIEVVGEAEDGHQTLEAVERLEPDLVLLDITMPGLGGLDVAARLAKDFPGIRVLMLTMHTHEEYVRQALRAGAAGYLVKDASSPELELAVRAVARGDTYLSPEISRSVAQEYVEKGAAVTTALDRLSPRQREVLRLIAEGCSTKQIAVRLGRSVKTVETHRAQVMKRLDIHDVPGLVRYAIRAGLVPLEQ